MWLREARRLDALFEVWNGDAAGAATRLAAARAEPLRAALLVGGSRFDERRVERLQLLHHRLAHAEERRVGGDLREGRGEV